jgi:hypothetical protein
VRLRVLWANPWLTTFFFLLQKIDTLHENNTYKAIRIAGPGYNFYYSIWCNNEHELYDMDSDPGQMNNLLPSQSHSQTDDNTQSEMSEAATLLVAGYPLNKIVSRLDSLLFVLKSCKGQVCRQPWQSLHPEGGISTLKDALSPTYDDFYEVQQTRVKFNYCWNGYVPEAEGSMWETDGLFFRDGLPWHAWV